MANPNRIPSTKWSQHFNLYSKYHPVLFSFTYSRSNTLLHFLKYQLLIGFIALCFPSCLLMIAFVLKINNFFGFVISLFDYAMA